MKNLLTFVFSLLIYVIAVGQDTLPARIDTPVQQPRPRVDSPVRRPPVQRNIVRADTSRNDSSRVSVLRTDTTRTSDTLVKSPVNERDIITAFRAALAQHPYFSFFASPVNLPAVKRQEHNRDLFFYVLLGLFFYFAVVKTLFGKYLNNLLSIFLRITLRQQQLREQLLQSPLPSLLMNIFFLLTGGLYASLLLGYYEYTAHPNFWIQTVYCIGILALIYTGKFVILKFTGWVFNLSKAMDTYIFIVFLVNKMLGMLLLPFLVLIAFYSGQPQQVFVTLSLIMIISLMAYRFIFSFGPIRSEIKVHPFHFFLYLCAFEIAPLLLIYKVLLSMLN